MTADELYAIAVATAKKHENLKNVNSLTLALIRKIIHAVHPSNEFREFIDVNALVAAYTPLYLDKILAIEYRADQINTDPYNIGALDLTKCIMKAYPTTVTAGSGDRSIITLEIRDVNGRLFPYGGQVVVFDTNLGMLANQKDHNDGTHTIEIRSNETGTATITSTIGGQNVIDNTRVIFE